MSSHVVRTHLGGGVVPFKISRKQLALIRCRGATLCCKIVVEPSLHLQQRVARKVARPCARDRELFLLAVQNVNASTALVRRALHQACRQLWYVFNRTVGWQTPLPTKVVRVGVIREQSRHFFRAHTRLRFRFAGAHPLPGFWVAQGLQIWAISLYIIYFINILFYIILI